MTQIPAVAGWLLQGTAAGGAAGQEVGSPAWFAWLADDAARSFSFRSPAGTYTARKERRRLLGRLPHGLGPAAQGLPGRG
jgi:hypothetical protein